MIRMAKKIVKKVLGLERPLARPYVQRVLNGVRLVGIDVGASMGLQPHWWTLHGSAFFYAFEPHPQTSRDLIELYNAAGFPELYKVIPVGLSGTGGERTLYMTNVPTGASILPLNMNCDLVRPENSYFFPLREMKISTRSLKDVLDEQGESTVDLIKLDIQGAELEVLKGMGEERISRLLAFEMEVGLDGVYMNQSSLEDVHAFAKSHNFDLFDLRVSRSYAKKGQSENFYQEKMLDSYSNVSTISARVREFDLVYFRNPKALLEKKDKASLRKLMVCYCTYNFFTEALKLAEDAKAMGVFSEEECQRLLSDISEWYVRVWHRFFHKPILLFQFARRVLNRIGLGSRRWVQYMWTVYPSS